MEWERSTFVLEMSHVGLGTLDECSVMTLFGSMHSRSLTNGLPHNPAQITDADGRLLYPAYFMTHLRVPAELPLESFALWDTIDAQVGVQRYGDTILESHYSAARSEESPVQITMQANSLFILDPSVFRSQHKQVSAPRAGAVRALSRLSAPPAAIREAAAVRAGGFAGADAPSSSGNVYSYRVEANRDASPGHPLMFAKIPALLDLAERDWLRHVTTSRIAEDILQATSLLERKTFYYGNAFAGDALSMHTRCVIRECRESLWKENPQQQYVCTLSFDTELYSGGELLAISRAQKVIVHQIRHQSLVQDTKRLLRPLLAGELECPT